MSDEAMLRAVAAQQIENERLERFRAHDPFRARQYDEARECYVRCQSDFMRAFTALGPEEAAQYATRLSERIGESASKWAMAKNNYMHFLERDPFPHPPSPSASPPASPSGPAVQPAVRRRASSH